MKQFALALTAVGALALVTSSASASDRIHGRLHDDLEHRDYQRELDHRSAHRSLITPFQHYRVHRSLQHEATHDVLEHRSAHRELIHRDVHRLGVSRLQHSQVHDNLEHESVHDRIDHRATHRSYRSTWSRRGFTLTPRGVSIRTGGFSLFFSR